MHLKYDDLIDKVVFLDGRRLAGDVVELDTKEGWVDIELPVLPKETLVTGTEVIAPDPEDAIKGAVNTKRLFGKVQVAKVQ